MPWIAISEASVRSRLADRELAALRTAARAVGQADPLDEVISRTVDEVRGYIAANGTNRLGPSGTLPAQLEGAALAIIRYRLATRLPVPSLLTDDRKEEHKDALTLLRDVAAGRFAVEAPDESGPENIATAGGPVAGHPRPVRRLA